jgi:hypothetical protein
MIRSCAESLLKVEVYKFKSSFDLSFYYINLYIVFQDLEESD